jgi:hypothetical protein
MKESPQKNACLINTEPITLATGFDLTTVCPIAPVASAIGSEKASFSSGQYRTVAWFALLVIFSLSSTLVGCGGPPAVTSPQSQELILRFYTACNTASPERLASAIEIYRGLIDQKQVSIQEQVCFDGLIALAEKGRWQEAADKAYAFSQSQVR